MLLPTWGAPAEKNRTWRVDDPTSRGESAVGRGDPYTPLGFPAHGGRVFTTDTYELLGLLNPTRRQRENGLPWETVSPACARFPWPPPPKTPWEQLAHCIQPAARGEAGSPGRAPTAPTMPSARGSVAATMLVSNTATRRTPQLSREKPAGRSGSAPWEGRGSGRGSPAASGELNGKANTSPRTHSGQGHGANCRPQDGRARQDNAEARLPAGDSEARQRGLGSQAVMGGRQRLGQSLPEGSSPGAPDARSPQGAVRLTSRSSTRFPLRTWGKVPSGFRQGDGKEVAVNSPAHPALNKACPRGTLLARASLTWAQGPQHWPLFHPGCLRRREKTETLVGVQTAVGLTHHRTKHPCLPTSPPLLRRLVCGLSFSQCILSSP